MRLTLSTNLELFNDCLNHPFYLGVKSQDINSGLSRGIGSSTCACAQLFSMLEGVLRLQNEGYEVLLAIIIESEPIRHEVHVQKQVIINQYMMSSTSNNTRESLCLTCCSSLPPSKSLDLFTTKCCKRPICTSCITSNPRLARYDPCLACLAGVRLLASTSAGSGSARHPPLSLPIVNLNGGVRDEDTFILGDDEEDEDEVVNSNHKPTDEKIVSAPAQADEPSALEEVTLMPVKYDLNPSDTLQGISLRFGVNVSFPTFYS